MLVLLACTGESASEMPEDWAEPDSPVASATEDTGPVDADGDGHPQREDCDDGDATVYPGAGEVAYDGIDQDCSGGDLADVDGDGFDLGVDCDDKDDAIHPDATEVCNDGSDNDCDGGAEECGFGGAGAIEEWAVAAIYSETYLGISFAAPGDHDGDGIGDIAVTGWAEDGAVNTETVWLFSAPVDGVVDLPDAFA